MRRDVRLDSSRPPPWIRLGAGRNSGSLDEPSTLLEASRADEHKRDGEPTSRIPRTHKIKRFNQSLQATSIADTSKFLDAQTKRKDRRHPRQGRRFPQAVLHPRNEGKSYRFACSGRIAEDAGGPRSTKSSFVRRPASGCRELIRFQRFGDRPCEFFGKVGSCVGCVLRFPADAGSAPRYDP